MTSQPYCNDATFNLLTKLKFAVPCRAYLDFCQHFQLLYLVKRTPEAVFLIVCDPSMNEL